jgi:HEAT repeat protein
MWEMLALSVLAGGAGVWGALWHNRSMLEDWQAAALSCGLRVEETSGFWSGGLSFKARAGPVHVQIVDPRRKDHGPQLVVRAPWPPGFAGIRIRSELEKPSGAREIEIGDDSFDGAFYIVGPQRLLFALLDEETRRLMIAVNAASPLAIGGGELRAEAFHAEIPDTLRLLLDIARRFTQPLDIAERLAENARRDPHAGVRLKNLLLLVRELPGEPRVTEALRAACADVSPQVRLRAAKELGAEGRGTLTELAESTMDDALSAQAVSILGRELPIERARAILVQALRRRRLQTARACLETLSGNGAAEDIETLAKVMARENNDLAAAAAEALGAAGSPAAEPPLLLALQHERSDVQTAAAKALGRAGSAAAVLPLKEAAEHTRDQDLRSATRQAIAEIQSRLQGASPGQLSLAEAEAGRLSLAEAEAGRLSLAAEDHGVTG